jgi:MFS transporter, MCT family, solute carrier family 16 (monocarboxylic acid transporters), member 10
MTDTALAAVSDGHARRARGMLVRAFLAHNVSTGCAFSGFGISVLALQAKYDTSRGMASMGLALTVLTMSGLGPVMAMMVARVGLRATMTLGVVLSAMGYVLLAWAPSIEIALMACGLLIGPGAALFGAIPPSLLAGGWQPDRRGQAVGLAYMPIFVTFMPILGAPIIQNFGLETFFLTLAGLHTLLLPVILGVAEPPVVAERTPIDLPVDSAGPRPRLLSRRVLWAIILGDGILNASTITGSAHIVPIAVEYGIAPTSAALLLSLKGGASIFGSILSGMACDKFGAARTLCLAGVGLAVSWIVIATSGSFPVLALALMLMGICGAAIFPPITVLVMKVFGVAVLPRVLGFIGIFALPFTFAAPIAGWLRDTNGDYAAAMLVFITASLVASVIFFLVERGTRNARAEPAVSIPGE